MRKLNIFKLDDIQLNLFPNECLTVISNKCVHMYLWLALDNNTTATSIPWLTKCYQPQRPNTFFMSTITGQLVVIALIRWRSTLYIYLLISKGRFNFNFIFIVTVAIGITALCQCAYVCSYLPKRLLVFSDQLLSDFSSS